MPSRSLRRSWVCCLHSMCVHTTYSNTHSHKIRHKVDADACEQFVYEMCHVRKKRVFCGSVRATTTCECMRFIQVLCWKSLFVHELHEFVEFSIFELLGKWRVFTTRVCRKVAAVPSTKHTQTIRQRRHLCLSSVSFFFCCILCRSRAVCLTELRRVNS